MYINLQQKKGTEAGKMVEDNHAHQTQKYKKKYNKLKKYRYRPGTGIQNGSYVW